MNVTLEGKRAIVTGGASGIGRAIAETFLASGASVVICDRDGELISDLQQSGSKLIAHRCDVADEVAVDAFVSRAAADLGGLDILVNNAGLTGPFGAIEELDGSDWRSTMDVNVNGMFYCTRRAVPLLKSAGGGAIINISSIAGRFGYAYRTPYSASKWAVVGLTHSLASELGPARIRVNALLPGFVAGPRHERNAHARAKILGITYEEQKNRIRSKISMRELTSPQDVANMATYLASEIGAHVSGQAISVDGNVETMGG